MKQYKYQQLASELKSEIDNGKWQANDKLPSIRELASTYNLAKISVQKALHTLEARDIIYVKAKSGYFVSEAKTLKISKTRLQKITQPKSVNVPDVFYDVMQRGAAFDISPGSSAKEKATSHLQLLNRHINRALRISPNTNALYYSEPSGELVLRERISEHYKKRNLNVTASDICITSGCQNSLFLALMTTCQAGDIVAVESPAFYGVLQLLQQLSLQIVEIPSSYTTGVSASSLEQAIEKWPIKACILTPNFSTPTGSLVPSNEKKDLADLAARKGIQIIEDDIYGDLGFHIMAEPIKSYDVNDNVILCGSFSKSLSRDLRIGWVITKTNSKKVSHLKLINQLSTSQAFQNGLASFLTDKVYDRHLQHYRRTLLRQRDQLLGAINQHWKLPIRYTVPDGGLAIWIELPESINSMKLYQTALAKNIIITPGRLFTNSNKFANYIRLSFAHSTTNHRLEAMRTLGLLLNQSVN